MENNSQINTGVKNLDEVFAPSAFSISANYIQVGDKFARTIFMATYPRYLQTNWFSPVVNLDRVMDISIFVLPKNTATVLKQLRDQLARLQSQAMEESSKGKVRDPILETAMQDIETLRDKLQQGTDKFFELGVYITIYENSVKELDEAENKIKGLLEYQLVFPKPAIFRMGEGFNSTLPFNDDKLNIHTSLNTEPLSSIFPFVSFDLTSSSGVLYGINTHNNSMVLFDRFGLENANAVVFGKSGGGKSILGSEPVLIRRGGKIQLRKIGPLVEEVISRGNLMQIDSDMEGVIDPDIEIWSFNKNLRGSWSKVSVAARKTASKYFYKFTTRSGRVITTTGDHNMVVMKNGTVTTLKSREIKIGQHVPLPRKITPGIESSGVLNLLEVLKNSKKVYVHGAKKIIQNNYRVLQANVIDKNLDRYLYKYRNGRRVPLVYFLKVLRKLEINIEGSSISALKLVSVNGKSSLPVFFPTTDSFLKIIGYIVAEGTITEKLVIVSNTDSEVLEDIEKALHSIGVLFFATDKSIVIGDRVFVEIIKALGGKNKSDRKHVLPFIFSVEKATIASYLAAYFEGDGYVEHSSIMATSKSKRLISDLCYLLYYFGIVARIKGTKKKAPGWNRKKSYWKLVISGQDDLRKFANEINFVSQRKRALLFSITARNNNTNVNIIPELRGVFKDIYNIEPSLLYGVSDISAIKRGSYNPSPEKLRRLIALIEGRVSAYRTAAPTYYVSHGMQMTISIPTMGADRGVLKKLSELQQILSKLKVFAEGHTFWDPIVKIEKLKNKKHKYVYDLTVDNEVLLAGTGGLFVHNSYTVKLEILRSLLFGTQVLIIDPENEYKYLADTIGGSSIKISINSDQHINPFDLPVPKPDESPGDIFKSHILDLTGLLKLIMGELTPEESSILDEALIQTYAIKDITPDSDFSKATPPILSDLQNILEGLTGAESMAIRLKKYTQGTFSGFLNKPTNVSLDNQLIAFSIREMEEELRPIAMYLILNYLWVTIRRTLKRRLLVVDEAWWLMKYELGANFLANIAKRARKYYAGLTTISQDIPDFLASPQGKTILTNSSIQTLMKQSPAAIDVVQKTFNLTDAEKYYLLEARVGFGLFFLGQNHIGIRVVASYAEDQIITSDPKQLLEIEKAKEEWAKLKS